MSDSGKLTDAIEDGTASRSNASNESHVEPALRYSVSQITTCRSSFADDVANWQAAGLTSIGLWRRKFDMCGETEAVRLIRESGLDVSTVSFAGGFTGSQGVDFNEAMHDAWQALFTAAAVGARTVVIAPGSRGRYTDRHEARVVVKALQELAVGADEMGIGLAVLPMAERFSHRWTTLHSLDAAWGLVHRVERDNVGMVFDTFHFGDDPRSLDQLSRYSRAIRVVQLSDRAPVPGDSYDRCLPGDGSLPLADIMSLLAASSFDGDIDIQVWSSNVWALSATDVLRSCRDHMQRLVTGSVCSHQSTAIA